MSNEHNASIITLLTDFGYNDSFVAQMKGVIYGINAHVAIIDITHSADPFNIVKAALLLGTCYKSFPGETIHVAVVDPGVGSGRRPIVVKTDKYCFVGPDNGIFSFIYRDNPKSLEVRHITASDYFLKQQSNTFQGRDLFAPIAAHLSAGLSTEKLGNRINDHNCLLLPEPVLLPGNIIEGEVFYIDHFGNAITNINADIIERVYKKIDPEVIVIKLSGKPIPCREYYSQSESRQLSCLINSSGYLELFVNQGNASKSYKIKTGDRVRIYKKTE